MKQPIHSRLFGAAAILLAGGISFYLGGCLEPYDFDSTTRPNQLAVYGEFTSQNVDHFLEIRQLSGYGEGPGEPIPFAVVRLFDDAGNSAFYEALGDGTYRLAPYEIVGIPGRSYYIEIQLSDGSNYVSRPQKMYPRIEADSAYFQFKSSVLSILVDTPISAEETTYFRWSHDEVYSFESLPCNPFNNTSFCYIQPTVQVERFYTASNAGLSIDRIEGQRVVTDSRVIAKAEEFKNVHVYNVYQRRIDQEAYNYWGQLDQVLNQQGTIFDPIPAAVPGNIINPDDPEDLVWGYFEVATVDTVRAFVTNNDVLEGVNNFIPYCPSINVFSDYINYLQTGRVPPVECCSCSNLPNQLGFKPDYF